MFFYYIQLAITIIYNYELLYFFNFYLAYVEFFLIINF